MRKGLLAILIVVGQQAWGQIESRNYHELYLAEEDDKGYKNIQIGLDYSLNSTVITNELANEALADKKIKVGSITTVFDQLKPENRIGMDFNVSLGLKLHSEKGNDFYFSIRNREHFNSVFSENLFRLIGAGNKQFESQTIDLAPFEYTYFGYQEFKIGIERKLGEKFRVGINGAFLKGTRFQQLQITKGEFYTHQDGEYIDFNTDLSIASAPLDNRLSASIGSGISVGGYLQFTPGESTVINAEIAELGSINYNELTGYDVSNNYHFDGIEFDLLNWTDTIFNDVSLDSLGGLFDVARTAKEVSYKLPAQISLDWIQKFGTKLTTIVGVRHRLNSNYKPLFYGKVIVSPIPILALSASVAGGGYSSLDIGIGANIELGPVYIGTDLFFLENWLSSSSTGQGIQLKIGLDF